MQLEHLVVVGFVLMCLYQLGKFAIIWVRDLPIPPDPWDALISFLRKDPPVPLHLPAGNAGMKKLLTANNWSGTDVHLLKGLLEEEGIPCLIKNESLLIAIGDLPPAECYQQLWLLDAADYARAKEILDAWRTATPVSTGDDTG
jgi:hypothetical protein